MIKRETIEDFIKLMVEHDLVELDVADGEQSITLRRAEPGGGVAVVQPAAAALSPSAGSGGGNPAPAAPAIAPVETGTLIQSPMVGTYYSKPSPDADPFINVGSKVSESTVVCLVEAMKVFNEIKAECKGQITEILVNDGDPVEFNQPLYRLNTE